MVTTSGQQYIVQPLLEMRSSENRNYKRPFGVGGKVSNRRAAKFGSLVTDIGWAGLGRRRCRPIPDERLGVVIRAVSTALLKGAGLRHCDGARTGVVTYIQRFGSKLNLNVHLHVLALDGAYSFKHAKARFHRARGLSPEELNALLTTVITRVTRTLVRAGVLVAEDEQPYLDLEMDSPHEQLAGAAIRYVIAAGPQAGRATMRLHDPLLVVGASGAKTKSFTAARDGFSLNCAVACEVNERAKLERLCRPRKWTNGARGPIAQERLSVDGDGLVVLELKRAFSDGTTHVL